MGEKEPGAAMTPEQEPSGRRWTITPKNWASSTLRVNGPWTEELVEVMPVADCQQGRAEKEELTSYEAECVLTALGLGEPSIAHQPLENAKRKLRARGRAIEVEERVHNEPWQQGRAGEVAEWHRRIRDWNVAVGTPLAVAEELGVVQLIVDKLTEQEPTCTCRGEREEAPPVPDRDCPWHGDRAEQEPIRSRAVANVDARHGYTFEFSASPDAHRLEYDEEEERLMAEQEPSRVEKASRAATARVDALSEKGRDG